MIDGDSEGDEGTFAIHKAEGGAFLLAFIRPGAPQLIALML